jgi:hypothetical protein
MNSQHLTLDTLRSLLILCRPMRINIVEAALASARSKLLHDHSAVELMINLYMPVWLGVTDELGTLLTRDVLTLQHCIVLKSPLR